MLFYVLRRVLILIPVYLGLTLSTFTLIRLVPGDAVEIMMGEKAVDPAMHAQALQRLGLDLPLPVQYWHYLTNILQGNFGESFRTRTRRCCKIFFSISCPPLSWLFAPF